MEKNSLKAKRPLNLDTGEKLKKLREANNRISLMYDKHCKHHFCDACDESSSKYHEHQKCKKCYKYHKVHQHCEFKKGGVCSLFGPFGPFGVFGPFGPFGPFGKCSATGAAGPTGATGSADPFGATAGAIRSQELPEYAYIYNLADQVVALEADINFSDNGIIVGSIGHEPGTATISLGSAGDYAIWFVVAGVEPNQFTVFQNGAPVAGGIYGCGAGAQLNHGMVIITAASGDVLTVRNYTSSAAITLQAQAGGMQINTNASILIRKLST